MDLSYLRPWANHIITDEEARTLTAPVTRAEIKQAFFDIDEDKAPGPDGYSAGFYKAAWPVIGDEIMTAVEEFFANGRLLKQAITKILILRLRPLLSRLVIISSAPPEMRNESRPPEGLRHGGVGLSDSHFTALWLPKFIHQMD
ncbi:UNVERIFIED_CONTAM: hypothetical protein Slati_2467600 [Sesamum latifolium]|uniref:Uncharacterized protein n=1 Tax=Sesamum latifolium TaxID=2727402 RepID=A0AAW2WGD3_9LAMI